MKKRIVQRAKSPQKLSSTIILTSISCAAFGLLCHYNYQTVHTIATQKSHIERHFARGQGQVVTEIKAFPQSGSSLYKIRKGSKEFWAIHNKSSYPWAREYLTTFTKEGAFQEFQTFRADFPQILEDRDSRMSVMALGETSASKRIKFSVQTGRQKKLLESLRGNREALARWRQEHTRDEARKKKLFTGSISGSQAETPKTSTSKKAFKAAPKPIQTPSPKEKKPAPPQAKPPKKALSQQKIKVKTRPKRRPKKKHKKPQEDIEIILDPDNNTYTTQEKNKKKTEEDYLNQLFNQ